MEVTANNRGRNYSTSREVIFGTLKTDRLIEGERLTRCRLIQVRLHCFVSNTKNTAGMWTAFNSQETKGAPHPSLLNNKLK